jgi:hypothetical protein
MKRFAARLIETPEYRMSCLRTLSRSAIAVRRRAGKRPVSRVEGSGWLESLSSRCFCYWMRSDMVNRS